MSTPGDPLTLAHWRRSVAELYADVRRSSPEDAGHATARFRQARERLFATHPESPVPAAAQTQWRGAAWFDHDPAWRILGKFMPAQAVQTIEIRLAADGLLRCTRVGCVRFTIHNAAEQLAVYWLEGYGGGLWLPFRDATNGAGTYGGGRYLYDTIKGADLGATRERFVLDFNFAYNPSCAYDDRWSCPLSPPENKLAVAVNAGEKLPFIGS